MAATLRELGPQVVGVQEVRLLAGSGRPQVEELTLRQTRPRP